MAYEIWLTCHPDLLYKCSPYEIEHQNFTVITTFWKIIYNSIILRQNVRGGKKKEKNDWPYLKKKNLRSCVNILEGPGVLE